jgi:hypothetical protein
MDICNHIIQRSSRPNQTSVIAAFFEGMSSIVTTKRETVFVINDRQSFVVFERDMDQRPQKSYSQCAQELTKLLPLWRGD